MRYEKIKALCRGKGVTVAQAERECGFAKGSLSKIDKHKPSYEKLDTLSRYFGQDVFSLLLEDEPDEGNYEHKTHNLTQKFREDQHLIIHYIADLSEHEIKAVELFIKTLKGSPETL